MVEAAGVELFRVLTARKLLIPGTATTAKKASLPDPLYVYCTKIVFVPDANQGIQWAQYHIDSSYWLNKDVCLRPEGCG
jgi:hypothetical protein